MVRSQTKKKIKPKVSVILPVRNGELYLTKAIQSILNQSLSDFELVIIDDSSIDASLRIAKRFRDQRIILLTNNTPIGVAESLNIGIKVAKGAFIARMDADDIARPNRLYVQLKFLENNPQVGVVGSWVEVIDEREKYKQILRTPVNDKDIMRYMIHTNPFIHPSVMLRKSLIDIYGGYDSKIEGAEDYDLWVRLSRFTKLENIPKPLIKYRIHKKSISKSETRRVLLSHAKVQYKKVRQYGFPLWHILFAIKPLISAFLH